MSVYKSGYLVWQVTLDVLESAAVGSLFALPAASDADGRRYGVLEYQLSADSTPPPPFDLQVRNCSAVWLNGGGLSLSHTPSTGQVT